MPEVSVEISPKGDTIHRCTPYELHARIKASKVGRDLRANVVNDLYKGG